MRLSLHAPGLLLDAPAVSPVWPLDFRAGQGGGGMLIGGFSQPAPVLPKRGIGLAPAQWIAVCANAPPGCPGWKQAICAKTP